MRQKALEHAERAAQLTESIPPNTLSAEYALGYRERIYREAAVHAQIATAYALLELTEHPLRIEETRR